MTNLPPLVIISGPPGAGKSTLARPLANAMGLPLISKDVIKELLADTLGESATDLSRPLGHAATMQLYAIANELVRYGHGVVVESAFHKGLAEADFADLIRNSRAVLVHVSADDEVLLSRYERRTTDPERHPIHEDAKRLSDLKRYLAEGVVDMLELDCPSIVIDTTYGPIDIEEVAMMVQDAIDDDD